MAVRYGIFSYAHIVKNLKCYSTGLRRSSILHGCLWLAELRNSGESSLTDQQEVPEALGKKVFIELMWWWGFRLSWGLTLHRKEETVLNLGLDLMPFLLYLFLCSFIHFSLHSIYQQSFIEHLPGTRHCLRLKRHKTVENSPSHHASCCS